ncbi:MAG: hypothetical protein ABI557_03645 [Aureliella sp.]
MFIIVGVECLLIDSATFASEQTEVAEVYNGWYQPAIAMQESAGSVFRPKEWVSWTSLASGAVVLLYAFTLPRRWGAGG